MFRSKLAGGFQQLLLEQALNLRPVLPVRNGSRLLVPVDAFYLIDDIIRTSSSNRKGLGQQIALAIN